MIIFNHTLMSFLGKVEILNENALIQIILCSLREEMNLEYRVTFYSRGGWSLCWTQNPHGSSPPPVHVGLGGRWTVGR